MDYLRIKEQLKHIHKLMDEIKTTEGTPIDAEMCEIEKAIRRAIKVCDEATTLPRVVIRGNK